jgi:hypothetical protein
MDIMAEKLAASVMDAQLTAMKMRLFVGRNTHHGDTKAQRRLVIE